MSEELKKEWEREFEEEFGYMDDTEGMINLSQQYNDIKNFISSLLAKQQIPTAMTNSEWVAYGKKMGYHDYWKDMTRIALQEEVVKMIAKAIEKKYPNWADDYHDEVGEILDLLADIKSKLNK